MTLPYEIRIGLRYVLANSNDRFVSFVSLLSAAGIALGVAALIVVLAVMNGFHQELRARILSVASHLEIVTPDGGITDWQTVAARYLAHPQITAAAPNLQQQALLVNGRQAQGALVRGILPAYESGVSDLKNYLTQGSLNDLEPGAYRVFLGKHLAERLRVRRHDKIILAAPQGSLTAGGFHPRLRRLTVAGIFSSGLHQYDSGLAYIHLQDAQTIYRAAGPASIRLQITELLQAPALKRELTGLHPGVYLHDWTNSHGGLFRALVFEKKVMFIILTLIIAVAAFNIVSALVTLARSKRGDIAILRAMGAGAGAIVRIFLFQGAFIGTAGALAGVTIGIPIAFHAGDIVHHIEKLFGSDFFPGSVYQLDRLPSLVSLPDSLAVAALAITLSLAAAAYPAWQSGKMRPADALRHE